MVETVIARVCLLAKFLSDTLTTPSTAPTLPTRRRKNTVPRPCLINGFMADGGLVASDQACNLVSFNLAGMFAIDWAT